MQPPPYLCRWSGRRTCTVATWTPLRVDRADVRQTEDDLTPILSAAGVHVMLIRLRYDGWVDEVINSAGSVANGSTA